MSISWHMPKIMPILLAYARIGAYSKIVAYAIMEISITLQNSKVMLNMKICRDFEFYLKALDKEIFYKAVFIMEGGMGWILCFEVRINFS